MKVGLWAEIRRLHEVEELSQRSIAERLHCGHRTVAKALAMDQPPNKQPRRRSSLIDPFREQINELIANYPSLSAVRIREEIVKRGYGGGITVLRDYLGLDAGQEPCHVTEPLFILHPMTASEPNGFAIYMACDH